MWSSLSKFFMLKLVNSQFIKGETMTKRKKGGKYPMNRDRDAKVAIDPFMEKVASNTKKPDKDLLEVDLKDVKTVPKITVDYAKTGKALIESLKFDHVGPEIADVINNDKSIYADEILVYPLRFYKEVKRSILDVGDGTVNEAKTKKVIHSVTAEKALQYLDEQSKCPLTLREGLEYIKVNPWWVNYRLCLVMLGTRVRIDNRIYVPYLFTWLSKPDTKKGIYLIPLEGKFPENAVFLATDADPKQISSEEIVE